MPANFQPQVIIPFTGFSHQGSNIAPCLPCPWKNESNLVEIPLPISNSLNDVKEKEKLEDNRVHSLSLDQTTQDSEGKNGETMTNSKDLLPSSLIFNIRRYSKRQKKFVLLTRHRKLITKCEHTDQEYYAKGMCKKCYHNKGERSKYATTCGHTDKFHYAKGLCKGCYLTEYHKERKQKLSK
mmetsp:Transcript_2964/g.2444  ORF Transcript_2964/g.2444 Transcript_2964/m.2444 type:complete len:182 (+) Transcript_2964:152-697(+)